jgi:hypothetical protein
MADATQQRDTALLLDMLLAAQDARGFIADTATPRFASAWCGQSFRISYRG